MANEKRTPKAIKDEIATTRNDPDIFSGWLTRLENPDPVLRTESGGKGLKLYDEVARDAHAGSVLQTRYLAVAGKEWEILPASDDQKDVVVAEFVKSAIDAINTTQAISELMKAVLFGFHVVEVMWQAKNGAITPSRLIGKHPRRFCFDLDRKLRMLTPANLVDGEAVPDRKFIAFTYGSSDNPYGDGLGQSIWWPVWFKKHGIKFWLVFLEKFGMPTTVGKYPPGTPADQQAKLLEAIEALQSDTGVKIPDSMKVELLEATRSGKVTYETLCEYMDRQISKRVLGQTASTEGTPGKLGNEDAQDDVRQDLIKADADLLCESLNATLVRWIVDLNFPPVAEYPRMWLRVAAEQDLKALSERDKTLVKDIGLPVGRRYFYDTYNVPEPDYDEDLVGVDKVGPGSGGEFAEGGFSPDQQAIENLIDDVMPAAVKERNRITADILAAVEQSTSYEELQVLLAEMLKSRKIPGKLTDKLSESMLAANLWGRYVGR